MVDAIDASRIPIEHGRHVTIEPDEVAAHECLLAHRDQVIAAFAFGEFFGALEQFVERVELLQVFGGDLGTDEGTPGTLSTESPTSA